MTPERYAEIEAKIASACSTTGRRYPPDEMIRDLDYLLAEAKNLQAHNANLLPQINTDSDVMWAQRMEIEYLREETEEAQV